MSYELPELKKKARRPIKREDNIPPSKFRNYFYAVLGLELVFLVVAYFYGSESFWNTVLLVAAIVSVIFLVIFNSLSTKYDQELRKVKSKLSLELKFFLKCQEVYFELEEKILLRNNERKKVLRKKIEENEKKKNDDYKSLDELKEGLPELPKGLIKLLNSYKEKIIKPRREESSLDQLKIFNEVDYQATAEEDFIKLDEKKVDKYFSNPKKDSEAGFDLVTDRPQSISKLKEEKRKLEPMIGKRLSMPMIIAGFISIVNISLAIAGNNDGNNFNNVFGYGTTGTLAVLLFLVIIYLSQSFSIVKPTDQGLKLVLGKTYDIVDRGIRFTLWRLATIRSFPTTILYLNVMKDTSMLTGDESQQVITNISQPYRFINLWDVIDGLGESYDLVKILLEGEPGEKDSRGMIGDKVVTVVRSLIADDDTVHDLNDALKMRSSLANLLKKRLNREYGHFGLQFELANTTDIDPSAGIAEGLNLRALQKINVQVAKHEAEAAVKKAEGDSEALEMMGTAEANVALIKFKKNVEAIEHLKDKGVADQAMPLISALVLAEKPLSEVAPLLAGMSINLYQIPGIDEILKIVGGYTSNLSKKA